MKQILKRLTLLILFGYASGALAEQLSQEESHHAAVYDMLVASPFPDLIIGGMKQGFKRRAITPEEKVIADCAIAKISRPAVTTIFTNASMDLFTEEEARELEKDMKSDLGKRGSAQALADKIGIENKYAPLTEGEMDNYKLLTYPFWSKISPALSDEKANRRMTRLLSMHVMVCKEEAQQQANTKGSKEATRE